ncbi:type III secretion protein [Paucibacter sp. KBW04]|uniref:EscU/YscU/HrcU family type III secretion system export apparatus switch protein n=1 Tax=Paucibacter sp. KBW04 TaxID=2153361 RepID=UPI000F5820BA|nr:EscU/YscU/HrcU family type III secretion system export apparatus switch protein [Paucibacter sp. KBW04]RQO63584.1 type III secretion protein [Paucibacter sp. KBW04]
MSAEQDLDRNEKASPFKLEEAKKRGQVAKSADAMSLAVLLVATVSIFALAPSAVRGMAALMKLGLSRSVAGPNTAGEASQWISAAMFEALKVLGPLLLVLVVVAVVTQLLQTGPVFSTTPLKPDWSRLNPLTGFKRMFSMKLVFEAVKSSLKLLAMTAVAWMALKALLPGAAKLQSSSPKAFIHLLLDAAGGLTGKLCAVLAIFAIVDLLYTRWDYLRTLRMSRREMTDEHKHRDGDPRIKARLRELRLEHLRRTKAVNNVSNADLLVTNPTHLAVAIRYRHGESVAPQLIAKGAGGLAKRMRDLAYQSHVPIVQSPALARALFKEVDHEAFVPERWYPQIAKLLVWAQTAKMAKAKAWPSSVVGGGGS